MLVRIISALAGWARVVPGVDYAHYEPGEPLKVLLVGYNGARNTGSDVRVAALAQQVCELMGDAVELSVMTLDAASTAVYFDGTVRQIQFSTLFFGDLLKACSEHHVAILCEGSTFKSKFADALTLYSCEAAGVMRAQGKACISYGSEVGAMEPYLKRTMRALCDSVKFSVRSAGSLEALRDLGFDGYVMTAALRSLSLLVTSRYHAQVLATGAFVPSIAVSMDERLDNLAAELKCDPRLLYGVEESDLAPKLLLALDYAYDNAAEIRDGLAMAVASEQHRLQDMGAWLANVLAEPR